ncbi:MAG: DNA mismatch repair endonuclease MutL [Christensenellales bacterium]
MAKINLLSPMVFNRIAAGEVVEKPCSVVKELVENSIDSGATNISISIERGGLGKIEVTDNGSGIEFDDLKNALLAHATSKISRLEDLDNIGTLGFRGEALSSIASVSEIEIISKTRDCDYGGKIKCLFGQMEELTQIASIDGTRITVKNLFHNVPARLKFVRKDKTEENDITNFISRLILANPHISFSYVADGKQIYKHSASDLKTAICDIYGDEIAKDLIEVKQTRGNMTLFGYISRPEIAKANRTYQTLIINGRYVINFMISSAISNVYEDYLMKGKFPLYVLCLNMPNDEIDVNVHPNKLEVKFENSGAIFSLFSDACFHALKDTNFTTTPVSHEEEVETDNFIKFSTPTIERVTLDLNEGVSYSKDENPPQNLTFSGKTSLLSEIMLSQVQGNEKSLYKQDELFKVEEPPKILCTLFDTYILLQQSNNIYLVDQHAAHERLNYDKLKQRIQSMSNISQSLALPVVINVNNQEDNFLQENQKVFEQIGFKIEEYGKCCYRINEIPFVLSGKDINEYFQDVFKNLNTFINKPLDFIKDDLCQKACKSSVKAGNKLTNDEIKFLIDSLSDNKSTLLCPHGRPIIVKITQTDIEKWFKRIV